MIRLLNLLLVYNDYFCESGNPTSTWVAKLYTEDPLWDGEGCRYLEESCCSSKPSLPWFHKVLDSPTPDHIELRVCGDQSTDDEDVPLSFYEIYTNMKQNFYYCSVYYSIITSSMSTLVHMNI